MTITSLEENKINFFVEIEPVSLLILETEVQWRPDAKGWIVNQRIQG